MSWNSATLNECNTIVREWTDQTSNLWFRLNFDRIFLNFSAFSNKVVKLGKGELYSIINKAILQDVTIGDVYLEFFNMPFTLSSLAGHNWVGYLMIYFWFHYSSITILEYIVGLFKLNSLDAVNLLVTVMLRALLFHPSSSSHQYFPVSVSKALYMVQFTVGVTV